MYLEVETTTCRRKRWRRFMCIVLDLYKFCFSLFWPSEPKGKMSPFETMLICSFLVVFPFELLAEEAEVNFFNLSSSLTIELLNYSQGKSETGGSNPSVSFPQGSRYMQAPLNARNVTTVSIRLDIPEDNNSPNCLVRVEGFFSWKLFFETVKYRFWAVHNICVVRDIYIIDLGSDTQGAVSYGYVCRWKEGACCGRSDVAGNIPSSPNARAHKYVRFKSCTQDLRQVLEMCTPRVEGFSNSYQYCVNYRGG